MKDTPYLRPAHLRHPLTSFERMAQSRRGAALSMSLPGLVLWSLLSTASIFRICRTRFQGLAVLRLAQGSGVMIPTATAVGVNHGLLVTG